MAIQSAALLVTAHEMSIYATGEKRAYLLGARDAFEAVYRAMKDEDFDDAVFEAYLELAGLDTVVREQVLDQCARAMDTNCNRAGPNDDSDCA